MPPVDAPMAMQAGCQFATSRSGSLAPEAAMLSGKSAPTRPMRRSRSPRSCANAHQTCRNSAWAWYPSRRATARPPWLGAMLCHRRHDQDPCAAARLDNGGQAFEAAASGHFDVQQDDVHTGGPQQRQGVGHAACGAHDFEPRLGLSMRDSTARATLLSSTISRR
jgi:hypothetical protein